jgi:nucleoside 2-deoxyribosyltransferase
MSEHIFTPEEVTKKMQDAEANTVISLDEFLTWRSTMKVYLAAPYSRKEQMNVYAADLRASGITVTSSWLDEPHKPGIEEQEITYEQQRNYAIQDVEDVQAADILVFFTDPTKTLVRAGRHVEFGIAVHRRIPIYVVGEEMENIFHYLPNVTHFFSWSGARGVLLARQTSPVWCSE